MYVYEGDYDSSGNFIAENAYFQGENYITGAIKSVVEGEVPSVYFLTGHGEKSIDDNYTSFRKNLKNYNYEAKELNLTTEEAVPDDAAIIIVPAPKKDITDDEKQKIDDYMDKGGNYRCFSTLTETIPNIRTFWSLCMNTVSVWIIIVFMKQILQNMFQVTSMK